MAIVTVNDSSVMVRFATDNEGPGHVVSRTDPGPRHRAEIFNIQYVRSLLARELRLLDTALQQSSNGNPC